MTIDWTKTQRVAAKALDSVLVFGAGALLDPSIAHYIGNHQGVATFVAITVAVLRGLDKAVGGKAAAAAPRP